MKLLMIFGALLVGTLAFAQTDLEKEKQLSAEYLAKMAAVPGAQVLEGGVVLRPIVDSASGVFPSLSDIVNVAYHLVDRKGKVLDESMTADEVMRFPLGK